ncbi:hypothetical protein JVT61DRAFT_7396 [Boletus reticuloceps]|uniref:Uncharacterized protein n=1 Tax=Boletus reticuloceps TaxID=495285 RepID=A0A8I2YIS4_9AGAM|nr:hypothetical protein JVT61DRAFT_7396 [Boletus reticuloceps]
MPDDNEFNAPWNSNHSLAEKGLPLPKVTSTGTTIVGCVFKDGIILGADTRATEGPIVADKNCEKVRGRVIIGLPPSHAHTSPSRYTTSQSPFVVAVRGLQPIRSSSPRPSRPIWICMHSRRGESRA